MDPAFTPAHRGGSGSPLVCLHGFLDTWRSWELVLPALERAHDVLAPTLPGHAGGPSLAGDGPVLRTVDLVDALEALLDRAGIETAHLVGNSLGGYLALRLAERGRARSVIALAPAGGWARGDHSDRDVLTGQLGLYERIRTAGPEVATLVERPHGKRAATQLITTHFEHIPAELLAHQIRGVAACDGAEALVAAVRREGWAVDPERIDCPVRMIWGTADKLLAWPRAAAGYRAGFPQADWVLLDGIGHCPQLDVPLETAELIRGWASLAQA
jgi:pimeloyl-ACP methyl ester carboxylesterase